MRWALVGLQIVLSEALTRVISGFPKDRCAAGIWYWDDADFAARWLPSIQATFAVGAVTAIVAVACGSRCRNVVLRFGLIPWIVLSATNVVVGAFHTFAMDFPHPGQTMLHVRSAFFLGGGGGVFFGAALVCLAVTGARKIRNALAL